MNTRRLSWLTVAGAAAIMLSNCAGDLSPLSVDRTDEIEEPVHLGLAKGKTPTPAVEPIVMPLIAARHRKVGTVTMWNDGHEIYVEVTPLPQWFLLETQLEIALSVEDIPQTKRGVPMPARFTYTREYQPAVPQDTYRMKLKWPGGTELAVALHASFVRDAAAKGGNEVAVTRRFGRQGTRKRLKAGMRSRVATTYMAHLGAWAGDELFSGRPWARYFTYTVQKVAVPPKPKPPKKKPPAKK